MPLTQNQFKAAYALRRRPGATQREVADECGLGLATVNAALRELADAGLAAEGHTTVEDVHYIERGYESIIEKLQGIGADIRRVESFERSTVGAVG